MKRVIVAAAPGRLESARAAALMLRDRGDEAIWLGGADPLTIRSAAVQEAADEVWFAAPQAQVDALRRALVTDGVDGVAVRMIGDGGEDAVPA